MLEHKFCRYAIESYLCIKKQMTKDFTPAPNAIIVDAAFLNLSHRISKLILSAF